MQQTTDLLLLAHGDLTRENSLSDSPQRILRREWKRTKPYLPKSTSLPKLQLRPVDRPIFTCRRCGFINTYIPLCLWCCWTSAEAHAEFERSMPRSRRASAPALVAWKRPADKCHDDLSSSLLPSRRTMVVSTSPVCDCDHGNAILRTSNRSRTSRQPNQISDPVLFPKQERLRRTDTPPPETVAVVQGGVATTTTLTSGTVFEKPLTDGRTKAEFGGRSTRAKAFHRPRPIPPALFIPSDSSSRRNHPVTPCNDDAMNAIKTTSRPSHIVIELKDFHHPHECAKSADLDTPPSLTPFPTLVPAEGKALRRKKRISPLRPDSGSTASSFSAPSSRPASSIRTNPRHSQRYVPLSLSSALDPTRPRSQSHSQLLSSPHSLPSANRSVRLGHPSRPYYTAIRPSMSRPSLISISSPRAAPADYSPSSSPAKPHAHRPVSLPMPDNTRPTSLSLLSIFPSSTMLNPHTSRNKRGSADPRSSSIPPSAPSSLSSASRLNPFSAAYDLMQRPFAAAGSRARLRPGFSVSGETELRMALARDESDADGVDGRGLRYKDMKKGPGVMGKVHRLKRGLRDFVARKTS